MSRTGKWHRWLRSWPLLAICFLAGSRWLLEGVHPEAQTTYLTEAAGCVMAAGFASLLVWFTEHHQKRGGASGNVPRLQVHLTTRWVLTTTGGALALGGPALGVFISGRNVSADNATLALALIPCVIAVATQAVGEQTSVDLSAKLWPGLAGMAGLLLLLPQPAIHGWQLPLTLTSMPLISGLGAACAQTPSRPNPVHTPRGAVASLPMGLLAAAIVFATLALVNAAGMHRAAPAFSLEATALDGTLALLSLQVLFTLGPTRWAVQFLLGPLITLGEGVILLRPSLDVRSWAALALLAISSTYLWSVGDAPSRESVRMLE